MFSQKKPLLSWKCSWQCVLLVIYLFRSQLCCLFPRLLLHMKRKQSHTPLWTLWHSSNCVLAYIAALKQATKVKKRFSAVLQTNKRNSGTREAFARLHFQKVHENYCLLSQFSHSIQIIYSLKNFCLLKLEERFQVSPLCQVKAWI